VAVAEVALILTAAAAVAQSWKKDQLPSQQQHPQGSLVLAWALPLPLRQALALPQLMKLL
jgi:hypothetical protein